jgi:predicted ArsR family transcriptional regulator
VFEAVDGPVVTTTDVADVLGVTTEAARQRLNGLVQDGHLRRRKTGRTVVYWRTDR